MISECFFAILLLTTFDTTIIIGRHTPKNQVLKMDIFFEPVVFKSQLPSVRDGFSVDPYKKKYRLREVDSIEDPNTILQATPSIAEPLLDSLFFFYGNFYGRVKGDSCLFYPTCSHFSRLAIRDYGLLSGLWMTGGRLIRAHLNFDQFYPIVDAPEGTRWLDLPEHERFELYGAPDSNCLIDNCPYNVLQ